MTESAKFKEEDAAGYTVNVMGRNVMVSEAMKNYAWDKLDKVERFHNHIMHVTVTLDIQKTECVCSILYKLDHLEIRVTADTSDIYASIDEAVDRLQSKLRRWKERIQDHHLKKLSIVDMRVNVYQRPYNELSEYNAEIQAQELKDLSKMIGTDTIPLKMLAFDEAVMKMELSENTFLIFKDEADKKVKVIYLLPDGNYGLVQPDF